MPELFPRIGRTALRKSDERGYLEILYESDACVMKRALSKRGVFRGLHWQAPPAPQVKLFRVVEGRIADVVVAMDDSSRAIVHADIGPDDGWIRIDAGFAHGYYAYEDSIFEYFCDGGYDERAEQAFNIADELRDLLGVETVLQSAKDAAAPRLRAAIGA